MTDNFQWRKIKKHDLPYVKKMLLENENDYVGACARFITRSGLRDPVWVLCGKNNTVSAMILNSGSTVFPVLCGNKNIPNLNFFKGFLKSKKIYSIQGLKNEVIVLEDVIKQNRIIPADVIDYELMSLDKPLQNSGIKKGPANLEMYVPKMTDIDVMAPLQAGYEKEEVIPKGSVFSPAASRINTERIITSGQVLTAKINGRMVGKININAVSFSRYQVGGVYVHPDFRGQGIAGRMTAEFISTLAKEGKGLTLFVKKNNIAARRIYINIGFTVRGDYRITYY
ncbi:MAG: GNAT family N-acetyltransferase [Treponema sp.]|nr:GNAT family N-acetyltransferase [Treponema sp.]